MKRVNNCSDNCSKNGSDCNCNDLIAVNRAIEVLNEAINSDQEAILSFFSHRVECNKKLADHKSVQVRQTGKQKFKYNIGVLGLINGLFGVNEIGSGHIAMVFDDNGKVYFERNK